MSEQGASERVLFGRSGGREGRIREAAAAIVALAQSRQAGSRDARRQSGQRDTSSTLS